MGKSTIIYIVTVIFVALLGLGAVINLFQGTEPEQKTVVIDYIIDGQEKPFDSYSAKHEEGEQLRVVSPRVGGYEPRIAVFSARVKSDIHITVFYDFKAPDPMLPSTGILYQADFNTADDWNAYLSSLDGLSVRTYGSNKKEIEAGIVKNTLHMADYGYLCLTDEKAITKTTSYTITFSMLFKSFEEDGIATGFSLMYQNYDGGGTKYAKSFRLDSAGKFYLQDGEHVSALETEQWYTFTFHVDMQSMTQEIFIDGVSFGKSTMLDPSLASSVCFRFFNTASHTDYYLDNFVIYEGAPIK